MIEALRLARAYGVTVSFADLGDWGQAQLYAEYEPRGPSIRINARIVRALAPALLRRLVARAVGHELYHHREQIGEITTERDARARERAADEYARRLDGAS